MMIVSAKLSKRKILAGLLAAAGVIALLVVLLTASEEPAAPSEPTTSPTLDGATNEDRVEYLGEWGWEVEPEPVETLQFLLPDSLEEPYLSYNVLQKSQGFDLSRCCGKQVARYTYLVTNYPGDREDVQVNLYLCEGEPVAGDVCCTGADGFRNPLEYPGGPTA